MLNVAFEVYKQIFFLNGWEKAVRLLRSIKIFDISDYYCGTYKRVSIWKEYLEYEFIPPALVDVITEKDFEMLRKPRLTLINHLVVLWILFSDLLFTQKCGITRPLMWLLIWYLTKSYFFCFSAHVLLVGQFLVLINVIPCTNNSRRRQVLDRVLHVRSCSILLV